MTGSLLNSSIRRFGSTDMKLTYKYTVHGFSGGMMLSNTVSGEWAFDSLEIGKSLNSPNSEVQLTVTETTAKSVAINAKYRKNEKTLTVFTDRDERFGDEANAYGFSYAFIVKE